MGEYLVERFCKPENSDQMGENYLSLYATGLSKEAYDQWLKWDEECFHKKVELAKQASSKGDIKAYTFSSTDTMRVGKKETKH